MFISHAQSAANGFKKWSLAHKAPRKDDNGPAAGTPTDAEPVSPAPVNGSEQTE